jgi:hypothetical protein
MLFVTWQAMGQYPTTIYHGCGTLSDPESHFYGDDERHLIHCEMFVESSVADKVLAVLAIAPAKCIKAVLIVRGFPRTVWEGMSEKRELMSLLSNS